jgi:hypothetical protein
VWNGTCGDAGLLITLVNSMSDRRRFVGKNEGYATKC